MTVVLGDLRVTIDDEARVATSRWPDGTTLVAAPTDDPESRARAKALGYVGDDAVWQMTRDHDVAHHLVARAIGQPWSWHLYSVARGAAVQSDAGDREERIVLLLQRVGREGIQAVAEAG